MKRFTLLLLLIMSMAGLSKAQHFTTVWDGTPGYDHMNFYIILATINDVNLEAGDEIAVFDGPYCVGAGVITGPIDPYFEIRASADDPITVGLIDGFTAGNSPSFVLWDASSGQEISDLTASFLIGQSTFTGSGSAYYNIEGTVVIIEPDIDASPNPLAFGDLTASLFSDLDVTISNLGSADLNISGTTITGSGSFTIQSGGGGATISAGASQVISIRYTAGTPGAETADLVISSDDPDEGSYTVALTGTSVVPDISASPNPATFGDVSIGQSADVSVEVSNSGAGDLIISSIMLSPVPAFSIISGSGSPTIASGETHTIVVRYTPTSLGATGSSIIITSNDPDESPYSVTLSGTGIAPEITQVPTSVSFGDSEVGSTYDETVQISNTGTGNLNITSTSISGAGATSFSILSGGEPVSLAAGATHDIVIQFAPLTTGALAASLDIASNDADENPLNIPLSGTGVAPDISATPNPASFGNLLVGNTSDLTVTVSNEGTSDLIIASDALTGANADQFNIETSLSGVTIASGSTDDIVVRFQPTAIGAQTASLSIASNDPDTDPYLVPLSGSGIAPEITVSPASFDYGDVEITNTSSTSIVISNEGDADLEVSSIDLTGTDAAEFTILSGGGIGTIAPAGSQTVVVSFDPLTVGAKVANLTILSDDADEGTVDVALTGNGVIVPNIIVSPNPADVGNVLVGASASVTLTVENDGTADLDITATSITGADASQFVITSGDGAQTIAPAASGDIIVEYTPSTDAVQTAILSISSNDPDENPLEVTLLGTGIAPRIASSPDTWNYGDIMINTSSTRIFNISNTGTSLLTVTASSIVGDPEFTLSSGGGSFTLAPSASLSVNVDFLTTTIGAKSAVLRFESDALNGSPYDVTLTANGVHNTAPVVSIPDQTIDEGSSFANIVLDNYVEDDHTADEDISWTYSGNSELLVTIVDRVATISVPDENWNGAETITFIATDDDATPLTGDNAAIFTVNGINDVPAITDIPDQAIAVGGTFTTILLDYYVDDIETADENITWTFEGNVELLVDITDRVATITTPSGSWVGSETVTFTATDDDPISPESGFNNATFIVTNDNVAPQVSDIPNQTVPEGSSFTTIALDGYVTDTETADENIVWSYSGNSSLTVSITNRVATISIPNADWNGSETITFTALDDNVGTPLSGSDAATFTVSPVNDAPVISGQSPLTIAEEGLLTITLANLTVTDVDNTPGQLSVNILAGTNYTVSGGNSLIPAVNYNGSLSVNLVVNDGTVNSNTFVAAVTVLPINDAPVVGDIPDQAIEEGESFIAIPLDSYVSDIETADASISWSFSGNSELLVVITNRIATISAPSTDWSGVETITFTATDNDPTTPLSASDDAVFSINDGNTAPVVSNIPNQSIPFGGSFEPITLDDFVVDLETPDADITWSVFGNSDLSISISADRIATITPPNSSWIGSEVVIFTATDDGAVPLMDFDELVLTIGPNDLGSYLSELDIRAYPNPTSGSVTIAFSESISSNLEIRVLNTLGQLMNIEQFDYVNESLELDLSHLTCGVYFIEIISDDQNKGFSIVLDK